MENQDFLNKIKKEFEKKQYGLVDDFAVQICSWNKKAIREEGVCYKEKFYGAHTLNCAQISPTSFYCQQNCIHCWRPMEYMQVKYNEVKAKKPEEVIDALLEKRKKLLIGFLGNDKVDKELVKKSFEVDHYAISLSGEPTLYPYINELIEYLKIVKKARTVFLVTNGQEPDVFKKMIEKKSFPTQLYVSLEAPNKELFKKICRSIYEDGFERLKETMQILNDVNVRKILRITLIRNYNEKDLFEDYKNLIDLYNPDFIEVKSYMHLGFSRKRLNEENQFSHEEIREWSEKLCEITGFEFIDEQERSIITLLKNPKTIYDKMIYKNE